MTKCLNPSLNLSYVYSLFVSEVGSVVDGADAQVGCFSEKGIRERKIANAGREKEVIE